MKTLQKRPTSQFYRELLAQVNSANRRGKDISYRQAVLSMDLMDSYCGKIKSGDYTPTRERLQALADFLDIEPTEFTAFVKRYADEQVARDDDIFETFRVLASIGNRRKEKVLKQAIRNYATQIVEAAGAL